MTINRVLKFKYATMPFAYSVHDVDHCEPPEDVLWGVFYIDCESHYERVVVELKKAWSNEPENVYDYYDVDGNRHFTCDGEWTHQSFVEEKK